MYSLQFTFQRTKSTAFQCMVISGESGSGKTETTRHIIHWLTTTQNKRGSTTGLAQSILGAGELLEVLCIYHLIFVHLNLLFKSIF